MTLPSAARMKKGDGDGQMGNAASPACFVYTRGLGEGGSLILEIKESLIILFKSNNLICWEGTEGSASGVNV